MGTNLNPPSLRQPTRVRFGVLGFACSMALLTYLDRICIMQARDSMKSDLGFNDDDMGMIFSAFIVGYTLFEVPGGWLGDVWGSRRVITRIVLCWSLFTALTGCVWAFSLDSGHTLRLSTFTVPLVFNSLVALLLIRFLFGVGESGTFPNLTRLVRGWIPLHERGSALGWIWTCARLGGFLAPVVLSWLTLKLGWRQAFWVLGALGVVWCLIFRAWFRDRPEDDPRCNDAERELIRGEDALPESAGHTWPPWRGLVGSLTVWTVCGASFFINFGWYFYATWQPKFWQDIHAINDKNASWLGMPLLPLLTGAPFLCGAVGTFLGGRFSDRLLRRGGSRRWSRSLIGITGYVLAGLCILGTGFTTTVWQAETLLCLGFLVNDLTVPIIWAVCADVSGRYAGTVSGLMNMVGGFGAALSPFLLPRVYERLHARYDTLLCWRFILAGLAVSWFLGAVCWIFIDASKPLFSERMKAEG
jgi:MFS transporter, ACS family, glucarate transporter